MLAHKFDPSRVVPCFAGFSLLDRRSHDGVRDALATTQSSQTQAGALFGTGKDAIVDSPFARPILFRGLSALLLYIQSGGEDRLVSVL